ncbi:uncharacterized protein [Physcomitrium patens]|uniref:Transmembrane protein 186 n=1 Tax=Physcomitrium patens TaxID=3218 RepID=A9RTS5_PHYPA|nr:uncharacterized protein LOC112273902 [Physcomitrium patens]XP_024358829.1 uncharacterized protein LOC112273902 [Physcomitrium patens]PNR63273.1 hypothetical protein PHYPA_001698 [Physcomitrium patens]|eukprot:XP_024358747.1 uncharacterized protein LOC112273902 [Physcomitrella patens]
MALRRCLQSSLRTSVRSLHLLEAPLYASAYSRPYDRAGVIDSCNIRKGLEWKSNRFASSDATSSMKDQEKLVLYRAKWMRPLRVMVRLKIFQLGGLAALALPLAEYANEGHLSVGTIAAVTAVVGGAGAASASLWYYSRRYVGEMALVGPKLRHVMLSVIDFWGNREDNKFELKAIVPPLKGLSNSELETMANQVLIPLDVVGERQFFLSLRYGRLIKKDLLFALLHGNLDFEDLQGPLGNEQVLEKNDSIHQPSAGVSKGEDSCVQQKV